MLNFKSLLFKTKYYSISYKLNFILNSNLFKVTRQEYKVDNIIVFNKFIFDKRIVNSSNRTNYYLYHESHRLDGPAQIGYYHNGNIRYKAYYQDGKCHKYNKPAYIGYYENGNIQQENYYQYGLLHRLNGPAIIRYCENGNVYYEEYYQGDKLHRIDKPAAIEYYENGSIAYEAYYQDGELIK